MISLPTGTRIWVAAGVTDMRRGFDGLAALVQTTLTENPFARATYLYFAASAAIWSSCCGGAAMA